MRLKRKKNEPPATLLEIQEEIKQTRARIETVENNYEFVLDHDLIDSYIFETNAAWKRYHFLLRQVRQITSNSI